MRHYSNKTARVERKWRWLIFNKIILILTWLIKTELSVICCLLRHMPCSGQLGRYCTWQNIGGWNFGKWMLTKVLVVINWWITSALNLAKIFERQFWLEILLNRLSFTKFAKILPLLYFTMDGNWQLLSNLASC